MPSVLELRQERAKHIHDARALITAADGEKRSLKAEEQEAYDKHINRADELHGDISRREKLARIEHELTEPAGHTEREKPGASGETTDERIAKLHEQEFRAFLSGARSRLTPKERRALEKRGMLADTDVKGGNIIAPKLFRDRLIKDLDNAVFIRQYAEKFEAGDAVSIGVPSLDIDVDEATWKSEIAEADEDTAIRLGKREMTPHRLPKMIKASNKFLRRAGPEQGENFIRQRMVYKYAVTEENTFLTGNGSGKPLGLFVAHAQGISTGRDIAGSNTTTALSPLTFFDAKYSLKGGYISDPSCRWIFHRSVVKAIMKLVDDNDQFLWQPGLQPGQPEMLLGIPVAMSEYAPSTMTAGLYVGLLGALRYYGIADAEMLEIQRLDQPYATTGQTGFLAEMHVDGMPLLENAFARIAMAAA